MTKKFLVVKSLFVPDFNFSDINIESIKSFLNYFLDYCHFTFSVKIIGWVNNIHYNDIRKRLEDLKKEFFKEHIFVEYDIWNENRGKIKLLNSLSVILKDMVNNMDYDYVIYADHDISVIDDILKDAHIIGNKIGKNKIHMISFEQVPDNRHNQFVYLNKIKIDNNEYFYSVNNIHIASGCFIASVEVCKEFIKLKSDNLYGDEDILIGELLNGSNKQNILSKKKVFHPFDTDEKYHNWKVSNIIRIAKKIK